MASEVPVMKAFTPEEENKLLPSMRLAKWMKTQNKVSENLKQFANEIFENNSMVEAKRYT